MNDMNFWEKIESLPFEKMHLRYMKIINLQMRPLEANWDDTQ